MRDQQNQFTRRKFLGTAAAAAAISIVPRHVLGGPNHVPPSEKVHVAIVGVGEQGMHVYCENLLMHNVWKASQVARVPKEMGVATQMGTHGHSGEGLRQTCEWIWDGAIGAIHEVHAWSDTARWVEHFGLPKKHPP